MRMSDDQLERTYGVWVECLKLNGRYLEYCTNTDRRIKTVEEIFREGVEKSISMSKGRTRTIPLDRMYDVFGNIFDDSYSFQQWWNKRMLALLDLNASALNAIKNLDEDIRRCAEKLFLLSRQDEPLDIEVIENALRSCLGNGAGILTLQVYAHYPLATLKGQFRKIIEDHKNQHGIYGRHEDRFLNLIIPLPTNRVRYLDKIKRYLTRRQLKQRRTWEEVIREQNLTQYIYDDGRINGNGVRKLKDDNKKLTAIINNAAKGIFPKY